MSQPKHYLLFLLLFCLGITLQAQTSVPYTKIEIAKTALPQLKSTTPTTTTTARTATSAAAVYDAGSTPGQLDVSSSGSINYTVPIAAPPGIKNMAPQISLSYNGQSGNSLAGYGWNITGLSTITRIPSTTYHDGTIDPVDFDRLDRFALDGQRLLAKSGTYGGNGTEYETENFSTLKIESYGTSPFGADYGPSHFMVYHPDGSIAWYGLNSNSRGRMEWAITKLEDPQGNHIFYTYSSSDNLLRISSISYGGNSSPVNVNAIHFQYRKRQRPEQVYTNGIAFTRSHILERIETKVLFSSYRSYYLTHETTSLGYEKITEISQTNGQGKTLAPITFDYDTSYNTIQPYTSKGEDKVSIFPGVNYKKHAMVSGDFNGNGGMDMVLYDKTKRDTLFLFNNLVKGNNTILAYKIPVTEFKTAYASSAVNTAGKFLGQQAIGTVVESTSGITFNSYVRALSTAIFVTSKTWVAPTYLSEQSCSAPATAQVIPRTYIPGDFNGDGLTDMLAISKTHFIESCEKDNGTQCQRTGQSCCDCIPESEGASSTYFIDLNQKITTGFATHASDFGVSDIEDADRLIPADYDGDGKTDLLHFTEGKLDVYVLELPSNQLKKKVSIANTGLKMKWPSLLGDYNGDGKLDFAMPTANGSKTWKFFIGNGNTFTNYTKNIGVWFGESGAVGIEGHTFPNEFLNPWTNKPTIKKLFEYHYTARDYNGDGKSDILSHHVITSYESNDWSTVKLSLHLNRMDASDTTPWFEAKGYTEDNSNTVQKLGIPVFMDLNTRTANLEYAYVDTNTIYGYVFGKDHRDDIRLRSVTNNQITTAITYNDDEATRYSVYTSQLDALYPYMDLPQLKGLNLVSELKQTGSGITRYQQFYYYGAKRHATGLGFLGFQALNRSNWFGDGVSKLWTNTTHDPLLRGAVKEEWISPNYARSPYNYISKTTSSYNSSLADNKRFKIWITNKKHEDVLQGITNTETITYDAYLNPSVVRSNYTGGSKTVTYAYSNNPSATDATYHIGRPLSQVETATLGGESFNPHYSPCEYF